jgi:hypothetical protein
MQTYLILRGGAWDSDEAWEASSGISSQVAGEEMYDQVRWIRSYVLEEEDGTIGTVCIFQAEDEDAIMEHAQRAELPADEITPVADTVIIRDDP